MKSEAMLRRYCRQVKSLLPCKRKQKKSVLAEIKASLSAFLAENPGLDMTAVEARFGTPQSIAAACVADMDTGEILRGLRIRRRVFTTVASVLMTALLLWGGVLTWTAIAFANDMHAVIYEKITEGPVKTIYDEPAE